MSIDSPEKERVSNDISFKQTDRLLTETIDPFQFRFSHPQWGTRNAARCEVEQAADAYTDAAVKFVQMVMDPKLLHGHAESDQKDVWIGGVDLRNNFLFMAFEESMMGSDNPQAWMLFQQIVPRCVRHARLAAEQIEAVAFFAEERQHVRAVDVFLDRITDMFRGDLHADTIRPNSIRLV